MSRRAMIALGLAAVLFSAPGFADVVRIDVSRRDDAGTHQRVIARVYFAIDPADPANQAIADIRLAPRNAQGLVEFSSDLLLFLPKTQARGRGTLFLEVVNRGRDQSLGLMSAAEQHDLAPEHWNLGDRFLLKQGFAVAFLGWQFDVRPAEGLTFQAPIAPVSGNVRGTYVSRGVDPRIGGFALPYCAADSRQANALLTVRHSLDGTAVPLPRTGWQFAADGCSVHMAGGFPAGLYEVVYRASGSPVAGLGFAAVRDFASYIKYGGLKTALGGETGVASRVLGFGYSQGGRFLREFVSDGFNADTKGRQAFDGLLISSAGAGIGSFNHRFAMPGEAGNSVLSILRPVDLPPFIDDDMLASARAARVVPRIFYTATSTEYWARGASLTHTVDGTRDAPLAPTSRLYFLAGTSHAGGPWPPIRLQSYQHIIDFADQRWTLRALTIALDDWVRGDAEPPASRYPTIAQHELAERAQVTFPSVASLPFPTYMPQLWRMDYGADFAASRIITNEPPSLGAPYALLLPQVDADGNDRGGVPLPEIAVPLGTYTGWNIALPALPELGYLGGLVGSFEPFARTAAERARSHDPRLSIAERYRGRNDYLTRVKAAIDALVRNRLALRDDASAMLQRAKDIWTAIAEPARDDLPPLTVGSAPSSLSQTSN